MPVLSLAAPPHLSYLLCDHGDLAKPALQIVGTETNISVFVFNACKTMIPYDHDIFIKLCIMETNTLTRYRKSTEDRLSEMSAEHLERRRTVIGP